MKDQTKQAAFVDNIGEFTQKIKKGLRKKNN